MQTGVRGVSTSDGYPDPAPSSLLLNGRPEADEVIGLTRAGLDKSLRVWGSVFVENLDLAGMSGPSGGVGWHSRSGTRIPVPYVIVEEFFLPAVLVDLRLSCKALSFGTDDYALPLTPAFFRHFGYAAMAPERDMLRVEVGDDSVKATLRLPLRNGGTLTATRTYYKGNDVIRNHGPTPALAIWPDFQAEDWHHYYSLWAASDLTNLACAPLFEDGRELLRSGKLLSIWPAPESPIGFAVYVHRRSEPECAGVVIRARPRHPLPPDPGKCWRIGIDVGSRNAHILLDPGKRRPEPLVLRGRVQLLTEAEAGMKERVMGRFPDLDVVSPFPAVASYGFDPELATEPTDAIGFHLCYPDMANSVIWVASLRWGPARAKYMADLAMRSACEARDAGTGELCFEWSMPQNAPERDWGLAHTFWSGIAVELSGSGGISVSAGLGTAKPVAAARCLATSSPSALPILSDALSIVVNVGRVWTDIGFWSCGRLLDTLSLRLGFCDLLPRFWGAADFVSTLYTACVGTEFNASWAQNFDPEIFIEAVLAAASRSDDPRTHPFVAHLFGTLPYTESPWVKVRSLIALFFSGIAFYAGLHARKLTSEYPAIFVYFGGVGSGLLPWIGVMLHVKSALENTIRAGFCRDVPQNETTRTQARGPAFELVGIPLGEEVARGLLVPARDQPANVAVRRTAIPGECSWRRGTGEPVPWDAERSVEELAGLEPPSKFDFSYIAQLIGAVLPKQISELNLDPRLAEFWDGSLPFSVRAREYLARLAYPWDLAPEPVYFAELRAVMDQYVGSP